MAFKSYCPTCDAWHDKADDGRCHCYGYQFYEHVEYYYNWCERMRNDKHKAQIANYEKWLS